MGQVQCPSQCPSGTYSLPRGGKLIGKPETPFNQRKNNSSGGTEKVKPMAIVIKVDEPLFMTLT